MSLAELLAKKKTTLNYIPPPPEKSTCFLLKEPSANPFLASIEGFNREKLREVDKNINGEILKVSKFKPGTALTDDDDRTEYHDSEEEVDRKAEIVASLIRNSKYFVAYTGAGISTSAGLADFRGENGIWTKLEQTGKVGSRGGVDFSNINCTTGHALLTLLATQPLPHNNNDNEEGGGEDDEDDQKYELQARSPQPPLKYLVTTNCDGLHLKSKFPKEKISELHGNVFKERCKECGEYVFREEMVYIPRSDDERKCPACSIGILRPTCVAFGDELPSDQFKLALENSKRSDLALVLGTSMKVSPACNLPEWSYKNKGHLVICNLQKTPYDKYAHTVIHCPTDIFLLKVYQILYPSSS